MFLSTESVDARDAFEFWRDVICSTFVRLKAEPTSDRFSGSVDRVVLGNVEMTSVVARGQDVRRTPSLISSSHEEYVLASIQVSGRGRVEQDGRVAVLTPGAMAFYDSTRPYRLYFDDAFEQLVVQVPRAAMVSASGLSAELTDAMARSLPDDGCGPVVASFFRSLARARHGDDLAKTDFLLPEALSLLGAAVAQAARKPTAAPSTASLNRQRVIAYVGQHYTNPALDIGLVARGCGMSRRTVSRAMGSAEGGVTGLIHQMRVDHAKSMLLRFPHRPVASVAGLSGFASEATFYRTFRKSTGMTPREYRDRPEESPTA